MTKRIGRRRLLAGAGALSVFGLSGLGCSSRKNASKDAPPAMSVYSAAPEAGAPPRGAVRMLEWDVPGGTNGAGRVAVLVPAWGAPDERFPVLFALHGRGEALKNPKDGALGWPRDYALTRAYARLAAPPLTDDDLEKMSDRARLQRTNADLAARPFGGVITVCPYLPDLDLADQGGIRTYGRFLIEVVLPRVRAETPAMPAPSATGIDGVSLGGAVALRVGLANPQAFGALGTLQAAVQRQQAAELAAAARAARAKNPALKLRLLTSDGDYFKDAIQAIDRAWKDGGIEHEYVEVPGPHDYPFNRGPGAFEMLLWHDRALRG